MLCGSHLIRFHNHLIFLVALFLLVALSIIVYCGLENMDHRPEIILSLGGLMMSH